MSPVARAPRVRAWEQVRAPDSRMGHDEGRAAITAGLEQSEPMVVSTVGGMGARSKGILTPEHYQMELTLPHQVVSKPPTGVSSPPVGCSAMHTVGTQ